MKIYLSSQHRRYIFLAKRAPGSSFAPGPRNLRTGPAPPLRPQRPRRLLTPMICTPRTARKENWMDTSCKPWTSMIICEQINGLSWIGFLRPSMHSALHITYAKSPCQKKKRIKKIPWKAVLDRRAAAEPQWATPAGWASKRTEMASSIGPDGLVGVSLSPDRRISAHLTHPLGKA